MNISHIGPSTCDRSHPPFCPSPSPMSCFSITRTCVKRGLI